MSEGERSNDDELDEIQKGIMHSFDDAMGKTLREIYDTNHDPGHPWPTFLRVVTRLVSHGYLEGKGDGFDVHYFLSAKGRSASGLQAPTA